MPINYKDAGVDVANGQKEVELIKKSIRKCFEQTWRIFWSI